MTGNSRGKPPACSTPRLTDSASPRRCTLQLTSSDHELQMPITGFPRKAESSKPSDLSQERCRKPSRSRGPNHAAERSSPGLPFVPRLRIVVIQSSGDRKWSAAWSTPPPPPPQRGQDAPLPP